MKVKEAIRIFQISQKNHHRKRTADSYRYLLEHLEKHFPDSHVEAITPDHRKGTFHEKSLPRFDHGQGFQKPKNEAEGYSQQRKC